MKRGILNHTLTLLITTLLFSYTAKAQPIANFTANVTSGCAPLRVEFVNTSTGSIEWDWNFGDGSVSSDENPVHYYNTPGTYTVVLVAYGAGASNTETKVNYITVTGLNVQVSVNNATCGQANGSINVTVLSGTPPITYSWSNSATTQNLTNLPVGNYRVTVTESGGCQFTETYHVENANNLTLSVVKTHVSTPGGSDGAIDLTVSGGSPPYTYSWNQGTYTTQDISGLPAGNYCVLVTDSNGCLQDGCFNIEQPSPCSSFEVSAQITDATCGSENGSINLTVTGGTPPYSFVWSNGSHDEDRNYLTNGAYRVTVEDAGGCRFTETFIVESTGNVIITGAVQNYVAGVHNGSIVLTITGGNDPYSYNWSNGESGRIVDGLSPGTYCVTVSDVGGCSADKCFLIEDASGGCHLTVTASVRNASSSTASDGRIEPFVSGGTAPYSYVWSTGSHDRIISGLSAGSYCVTVTDANGCMGDSCFAVQVATGCSMSITGAVVNVSGPGLHDGRITLTVIGGTSPYTYHWSNGATSKNIDGLAVGQYCVTVTDVAGCVADKCFFVETSSQCGGFSFAYQITNAICGASNGSINLIITGGTPPYTYVWTNGSTDEDIYNLAPGNYRFTATDFNGCQLHETLSVSNSNNNLSIASSITNLSAAGAHDGAINLTITGGTSPYTYHWTHGATTEDLTGLEAGTYCILVVDANGCAADGCFNVLSPGTGCGDFSVTGSETPVGCGGTPGSIDVTVSFGTPPYYYLWSTGATTQDISGLAAGTYTLTVEDSGPCRKVRTFTVGYAGGFQITGIVTPAIAGTATGSIVISMSGATGPFTFQWSNGDTTQNIDHLPPGQYCVLVTAANGCIEDKCFTVGVTGGCGDFYVTAHDDIFLCAPGQVFLEANAFFGTQPYSFSWSPATGLTSPNDRITHAQVDTTTSYVIVATDDNGCTSSDTVTVFVSSGGSNAGVAFDSVTICQGDSVQLIAFGGGDYFWDPGNSLSDRNNNDPWASPEHTTNYVVRISSSGCISTFTVHVEVDEDCVWPGDANSDGIANNQDILAIGIGNGIGGFPRPNATNNWEGQFCPDWFLALASGPNLKHVDCDGSGMINAADTLPLFQNYGFTHNRSGGPGSKFVDPELYFDLPTDTALAGQDIDVPVYLGTSSLQVSNFYGVAFTVNYDNTIVKENTMRFSAVNSFAGNVGDLLDFDYDMYAEQKMDAALTRLNRISVGGWGQIGTISFTMKDDISGKDFLVRELALSFSDVRAIDNNENDITLYYDGGSLFVEQEVSGVAEAGDPESLVTVYPNPAHELLNIKTNNGKPSEEVRLFDLPGREVLKIYPVNNNFTLDLGNLPAGSYLLKIKLSEGEAVKKVTVTR